MQTSSLSSQGSGNGSKQYIKEREPFSLSNYIMQNKIGEGAFGKVYQVKNKKTGQIFAAKISIDKIEDISEDSLIDLYREVNIISNLDHPSVLKFIGFSPKNFKGKSKPVIITEFANNGSLSQLILQFKSKGTPNTIDTQKTNNYFWNCSSFIIFKFE